MPSLKEATQKPKNLNNMKPVQPGSGSPTGPSGIPPVPLTGLATTAVGPIPSILGTTYDTIRQWIRPSNNPQYRIFPLPAKANSAQNAVANSAAEAASAEASSQLGAAALKAIGTVLPGTVAGNTVTPATLNSVADSSTRYAQTASGLSYRPTTNPLSATDAGSSATIDIAAFTMLTSSKGSVSVSSGSIVSLSYSTLYYVYYSDPTLSGGSVVYQASTVQADALSGNGTFFVGSILTPAASASDVLGNFDGGVGAQSGDLARIFFSTLAVTNVNATITDPANCYDGNTASFAAVTSVNPASNGSATMSVSLPMVATYSFQSATLKVKTGVPTASAGGGALAITLRYSLDAGSTWTNIYSISTTRAVTIDSITLNSPLNLARIIVEVESSLTITPTGSYEVDFYEAWLEISS